MVQTTKQAFVHPTSAETFEGLAKLARKLEARLTIDHMSEDGTARVRHGGDTYHVDPNGRCTVGRRVEEPVEL